MKDDGVDILNVLVKKLQDEAKENQIDDESDDEKPNNKLMLIV